MKKKILPIIIIAAVILLAGVSVFLGNKLLTTRNESVSPAAPESKPAANAISYTWHCDMGLEKDVKIIANAQEIVQPLPNVPSCAQNNWYAVKLTFEAQMWDPSISRYKTYNELLGGVSYVGATNWCESPTLQTSANGMVGCWDNDVSVPVRINKDNRTITLKRYANATNATDVGDICGSYQLDVMIPQCGDPSIASAGGNCATGIECPGPTEPPTEPTEPPVAPTEPPTVGQHCAAVEWTLTGATATPTPTGAPTITPTPTATPTTTATPTPTATPKSCNLSCNTNADCAAGLTCSGSMCRNPGCTGETDCVCPTSVPTARATATPVGPSLPNAGIGAPTIMSLGGGLLLVITAILLAL